MHMGNTCPSFSLDDLMYGTFSHSLTICGKYYDLCTMKLQMNPGRDTKWLELICPPFAPTYYRETCSFRAFKHTLL